MNKWMKFLTGAMTACVFASAGIAGGVAIAEEQAQTKYEQMLEEEKQSAVDEYKQTINIGYSEEDLEEAENAAREEGKQEGLTEGYENGYNQALEDFNSAGSEENVLAQQELMALYGTGNAYILSLSDTQSLVSCTNADVQGAYLHDTELNLVEKVIDSGFDYSNVTSLDNEDGSKKHYISSSNSVVLGLYSLTEKSTGKISGEIKKLSDVGYNYIVKESSSKIFKVAACSSVAICLNSEDSAYETISGSFRAGTTALNVGTWSFSISSTTTSHNIYGTDGISANFLKTVSGSIRYFETGINSDFMILYESSGNSFSRITASEIVTLENAVISGSLNSQIEQIGDSLFCKRGSDSMAFLVNMFTDELRTLSTTSEGTAVAKYGNFVKVGESQILVGYIEADTAKNYIAIIDGGYNVITLASTSTVFVKSHVVESTKEYVIFKYTSEEDGLTYQMKYTYATGARETVVVE